MGVRVIDVHQSVYAANDELAKDTRAQLKKDKTFMVNLMASPGAGKTTTLLRTIEELKGTYQIGIMEADIAATVDAEMTRQAMMEFDTTQYDLLFLENVGNLVCPAETDTGASKKVAILSYPEGDDKPLKYPLMFEVCDAVLINKIDTRDYFPFDDAAVVERIHKLNPNSRIFFVSARTGEGFDGWISWLKKNIEEWNA